MLTEEDVLRMCDEFGVIVHLHKGRHPKRIWGFYNPDTFEANVYLSDIPSEHDLYETVVHELIHARDDLLEYLKTEDTQSRGGYLDFEKTGLEKTWQATTVHDDDSELERAVIAEARETCEKNPEVIALIKELYEITYPVK